MHNLLRRKNMFVMKGAGFILCRIHWLITLLSFIFEKFDLGGS